jgi:hypothetical protein
VSAGNDAHVSAGFNSNTPDFDQGDAELIVFNTSSGEQALHTVYSAQGPSGEVAMGNVILSEDPAGAFDVADCVGSATLLGG